MIRTLPAAVIIAFAASPVFSQSADGGEKIFKKCAACHQVGPDAKNKVGPILTGVIGRPAGSVDGYKYSKSMRAAAEKGLEWNDETVFEYLADPTKYLRGFLDNPKAKAKMTFKLKKPEDRHAVIAYLGTFSVASAMSEEAVPVDGFCIVNASEKPHFFVTETREGDRNFADLAPGERLCANGTAAKDGIVSVFESEDALEGCSRVIATGIAEEMLEYAEFDRCGWSSHKS